MSAQRRVAILAASPGRVVFGEAAAFYSGQIKHADIHMRGKLDK
jgi:hypothetical protein